jgi:hypothetical protein
MSKVDDFKMRLEYGRPFMIELSYIPIKDIVAVIEKIWDNSCSSFYDTIQHSEEIKREYENRSINVEYNSKMNIESIKLNWSFYDTINIELSAYGLRATYKPEHGCIATILDLSWVILEDLFSKLMLEKNQK